jgi:hypothetical protein
VNVIGIKRAVFGGQAILALTADAEARLRLGISHIGEMVDVEQKFDIVLANLVELEQELATRSLKYAFHSDHGPREMLDDRLAFNRRVMNLLTATRLYADQAKHHIRAFFPGDRDVWSEFNGLFSAEYDGHLAYRVMEALRNYAQHRGLPLQGFSHAGRWIDLDAPEKAMESNVALNLAPSELRATGGFKPAVLAELEALGEKVDIKQMIREHVECLGRIHLRFRELVKPQVDVARSEIEQAVAAFAAIASREAPAEAGLAIVSQYPDGTYDVLEYLPRTGLEYLDILQARSRTLISLSRRFVSTRKIQPKSI